MTHPAIPHLDAAEAALDRVVADIGPDVWLLQARLHLAGVRQEIVRSVVAQESDDAR